MHWHEASPQRWANEQSIAAMLLEDYQCGIDENGHAFHSGWYSIMSAHGHLYEKVKLRIVYPATFPTRNQTPAVYLESLRDKWKKGGDSHIEADWKLCLYVPSESGIDFDDPNSLNLLFAIIQTFMFKQRIYQKRLLRSELIWGKPEWPGEDRSHGVQGIREAVRDSDRIGKNGPCPCGSGKKYKYCHLRQL